MGVVIATLLIILCELCCLVCVIALLAFSVAQALLALSYYIFKGLHKPSHNVEPAPLNPLPTVLVQLPVYNELYVVESLMRAIGLIDYPKSLLTIQVLDDSTDETSVAVAAEVARLRSDGFQIHHMQRNDRSGFKAGALAAGLVQDKSEFVAIFDADFLPQPNFLQKVLRYFDDPRVGLVQTRWSHLNRNQSIETRLLAFGLDGHFSFEQGGRQAVGAFVNFNGTAGMWRRATIDDAGGWSADCLTEDLDLSFRSQLRGWTFRYVEDVTTPSELPATISAIRAQQFRWTKGSAETARKNLGRLLKSDASLSSKFFGTWQLLNSLIYPFSLMLGLMLSALAVLGGPAEWRFLSQVSYYLAGSFLLMILTYTIANKKGGLPDSPKRLLEIFLFSGAFVAVVVGLSFQNSVATLQGLQGKASSFVRTPKQSPSTQLQAPGPDYKTASSALSVFCEACVFLLCLLGAINMAQQGIWPAACALAFNAAAFLIILLLSAKEVWQTKAGLRSSTALDLAE